MALSIANGVLLLFASMKYLLVLQQCGYWRKRYFKWVGSKDSSYNSRLMLLCLLAFLFFCVLCVCFSGMLGNTIASYVGFVSYFLFMTVYINTEKNVNSKIPLRKTPRLVRLIITYIIVLTAVTFGVIVLFNYLSFVIDEKVFAILRFSVICVLPVLVPYLLFAAYCINEPLEWCIRRYYLEKARQKLATADVIRIGITGSYGKTSVKEILKTILEEKYKVLATPSSYNTPMGICKTVKKLQPDTQIFIAEMGARHMGDIAYLASIVKPDYAIINGIVGQHLETFGSLAAIRQTKYELVESMSDGVVAYTVDNENTSSMFADCKIKSIPAGTQLNKNPSVYADNIKTTCNGSDFILYLYGKSVRCHTMLLGKHNITNICLAAAIAYELGLGLDEISGAISRLKPIKHRLECIKGEGGVTIIDDSYNANADGISAAMQVLACFEGRKIVVTPGLVELGREEDLENYRLGKKMAEVCDIAVLVGKSATYRIQDGLIDGRFNSENIIICKDLESAKKKLKKMLCSGDVVLFENDLPDKFS